MTLRFSIAESMTMSIFNSTGEGCHDTVSFKSSYTRPLSIPQSVTAFYLSASFD